MRPPLTDDLFLATFEDLGQVLDGAMFLDGHGESSHTTGEYQPQTLCRLSNQLRRVMAAGPRRTKSKQAQPLSAVANRS